MTTKKTKRGMPKKLSDPKRLRNMTKKAKAGAIAKPDRREPTDSEKRAILAAYRTWEDRLSRPMCSLTNDEQANAVKFEAGHSDEAGFQLHLGSALGSRSPGFRHHMIDRICNAMTPLGGGIPSENAVNAAFAILGAIEPRDELEGIIGVQIAATNDLSLELLAAARRSRTVEATSAYINQATKVQRTMCAQLETLAKMRRGGEQVVRHIHVDNRGGQAVIAEHVQTGGVANGNDDDQSHGQGALGPALPGKDPLGCGMPIPGDQGEEEVPTSWRNEPRRASRK